MKGSPVLLIILVSLLPVAFLSALILGFSAVRWQPPLNWKEHFGNGGPNANDAVSALSSDDSGVYSGGHVNSSVFLRRDDLSGNEKWTRRLGDPAFVTIARVAVGVDGVYYAGNINFSTVIIGKFDRNGSPIWQDQIGNLDFGSEAISLSSSNLYLTGTLTSGSTTSVMLLKYNFNGALLWTRTLNNVGAGGKVVVFAGSSEVYVSISSPVHQTQVDTNASISAYGIDGALSWTKRIDQANTVCNCAPDAITGDSSGIYLAVTSILASTNASSLLRKFSIDGNPLWSVLLSDDARYVAQVIPEPQGLFALTRLNGAEPAVVSRVDTGGHGVWAFPVQEVPQDLGASGTDFYLGGADQDTNAYLASYSQSSSLILAGINPPLSYLIVGGIAAPAVIGIVMAWKKSQQSARVHRNPLPLRTDFAKC